MTGRTIFDHHDVTDEDIRHASYGEDAHYWADVSETEDRLARQRGASEVSRKRDLMNGLTAEEYDEIRRLSWTDLDGLQVLIDEIRSRR